MTPRKLYLYTSTFLLSLVGRLGSASAHEIGFAEQVLQPMLVPQSLLAVVAVGLASRQQETQRSYRTIAFVIGLGLLSGLPAFLYDPMRHRPTLGPLVLAAVSGGAVAFGRPVPTLGQFALLALLGATMGFNLHVESTHWADLAQSLVGTFIGTMAAIHAIISSSIQPTNFWFEISVRLVGSWIFAIAIMIIALESRTSF